MWEAIDNLCSGESASYLARATKRRAEAILASLREAAARIPGHKSFSVRERILFWRGKQIGVAEFFAGLRDAQGFPIVERDLPVEHPDSHSHDAVFPEH